MNVERSIRKSRELFRAKRVYADPVVHDGVTVIPAAAISGGGGGGGGENPDGNTGGGTGFGINARPVGAWIVREGHAEWKPSLDLTRAILGAQLLILLGLLIWWARQRD